MNTLYSVGYLPMIVWLTGSCGILILLNITKEYPITCHKPRERSKFKAQFLLNVYCFPTIVKLKNSKSNHHKLGTICGEKNIHLEL